MRTILLRGVQIVGALLVGVGALAALISPEPNPPAHPPCRGTSLVLAFDGTRGPCHETARTQALGALVFVVLGIVVVIGMQLVVRAGQIARSNDDGASTSREAPLFYIPPAVNRMGLAPPTNRNAVLVFQLLWLAFVVRLLGVPGGALGLVISEVAVFSLVAAGVLAWRARRVRRFREETTAGVFRCAAAIRPRAGRVVAGQLILDPNWIWWESSPRMVERCPSFTVPRSQLFSAAVTGTTFLNTTSNVRMTVAGNVVDIEVTLPPDMIPRLV